MAYQPKQTITHRFNQSELDALIAEKVWRYENMADNPERGTRGGSISVYSDNSVMFLQLVQEHIQKGYVLNAAMQPNIIPQFYRAYFLKPQAVQEADIKQIRIDVEKEYAEMLNQRYEAHKAAILAESRQRFETEQRKKLEAEAAAREAKWIAEAEKALGGRPIIEVEEA